MLGVVPSQDRDLAGEQELTREQMCARSGAEWGSGGCQGRAQGSRQGTVSTKNQRPEAPCR